MKLPVGESCKIADGVRMVEGCADRSSALRALSWFVMSSTFVLPREACFSSSSRHAFLRSAAALDAAAAVATRGGGERGGEAGMASDTGKAARSS